MEINHCPVQAVLEGEIGVLVPVPCCRVFSWDDWYLKTVAVHQGFQNVTLLLSIYCTWEHKPSVCVKLQLSSRITALKKKKVKLISKAVCWWGLCVSSFKFSIIQQSDGVGGVPGGSHMPMTRTPPGSSSSRPVAEGSFSSTHSCSTPLAMSCPANPSPVHFTGLVSLMVPLT